MAETERKTKRKPWISYPRIMAALALLLATNIVMAVIMTMQSHIELDTQLSKRMLDIANSAADIVTGDEIRDMTEEDIGSPEYDKALGVLRTFQNNIDLSYIYAVSSGEDGNFYYTIDPDPTSAAGFGEAIEATPALISASKGEPDVDETSHSDRWGTFISAYSPIFDSNGKVAGIIGVDFDAELYNKHMWKDFFLVLAVTAISMTVGVILAAFVIHHRRKNYAVMEKEMEAIVSNFEKINQTMMKHSIDRLNDMPSQGGSNELLKALATGNHLEQTPATTVVRDEVELVQSRLHAIQDAMQHFLSYIDSQTYIDPLTGVGNKLAYKNAVAELEADIARGNSQFAVGFLDVNDLRLVNSAYGFENGDTMLYETGAALRHVFTQKNVFRVASDEFIVLMRGKTLTDMDGYFEKLDKEIRAFNEKGVIQPKLTLSKGCSAHHPDDETDYRAVFRQAEEAQKHSKAQYHAHHEQTE